MIKDSLTDKTPKEKANLKSDEIVKLAKKETYTKGEYSVEIKSVTKIEDGVEVLARAFKGDTHLGFGADGTIDIERFIFINPPIMVPDGTKQSTTGLNGDPYDKDNFKEDAAEALRLMLADIVRQVGKTGGSIVIGKVGSTVTTVYSSSDDSMYVQNTTWSTARGAASGTARGGASGYSQCYYSGASYLIERLFFNYDTSSIPDSDVISSATLSLYANSALGANALYSWNIFGSTAADTLTGADYDQGGTTAFSTAKALNGFTTSAYNDFSFNASGLAAISKIGISKFAFRNTNYDVPNSAPANDTQRYVEIAMGETTGTTSDPKLVITHAAAAGVSPSASLSASVSPSASSSPSVSPSASISASVSPSASSSASVSPSASISPSPSVSPSVSPSSSISASISPSPSVSPSISPSPSISASVSPSPSISPSPSVSPSVSPSSSISASVSPSPSISPSTSVSPSVSPSASISASVSPSPSVSPSASESPSVSPSTSLSASVSPSVSPSASGSASVSSSASPSGAFTATLMRYDGATWVKAHLQRFDGSSWVDTQLRYYDGSSWIAVDTSA